MLIAFAGLDVHRDEIDLDAVGLEVLFQLFHLGDLFLAVRTPGGEQGNHGDASLEMVQAVLLIVLGTLGLEVDQFPAGPEGTGVARRKRVGQGLSGLEAEECAQCQGENGSGAVRVAHVA